MALVALGRVQQQRVRDLAHAHSSKLREILGEQEEWHDDILREQRALTAHSNGCSGEALGLLQPLQGT